MRKNVSFKTSGNYIILYYIGYSVFTQEYL